MSNELVRIRSKLRYIGMKKLDNLINSASKVSHHFSQVILEGGFLSIVFEEKLGVFFGVKENERFDLVLQDKIVYPALDKYEDGGLPPGTLYNIISESIGDRFKKQELQTLAFFGCGYRIATTWLMAFDEGKGEEFRFLLVDAFGLHAHGKGMYSSLMKIENKGVSIQDKGGAARKARYAELEKYAVMLWKLGNFKSKRQASRILLPKVNKYARENGLVPLTETSGAETIYKYLLKN
jgi:hypothetical protein